MQEASAGKDTLTGHWEPMGVIVSEPFPNFPQGLPRAILNAFEEKTGWAPLGGHPASGTEIIEALGKDHPASGRPIVYTLAEVFSVPWKVPGESFFECLKPA
jgi:phosphopentomutase